VTSAKSGEF